MKKYLFLSRLSDLLPGILLLVLIFLSGNVKAGSDASESELDYKEEKTILKAYPISKGGTVELKNKYGDIEVVPWAKDSVKFVVKIKAESDDDEFVELLFEMADVRFVATSGNVRAELLWGENVSAIKRSSVDVSLSLKKDNRISIDYEVYVPQDCNLKIENRFGDVVMGDLKSKFYLKLFHGDLKAESIFDARSVEVKYGRVDVEEIIKGNFDLSFGKMNIQHAQDLAIDCSASEISLGEVGTLVLKSSNDDVDIDLISKLSGSSTLSDIYVQQLGSALDFNFKLGDIRVRKIESNFTSIRITGYNADVDLGFKPNSNFQFDVELENSKGFIYPENLVEINSDETLSKKRMMEGQYGKSNGSSVVIQLKASNVRWNSIAN